MNYSTTNSSGTSSVAVGVGHFLLFPAPLGGGFVAFCALLKLIPTYIPGWGGSGFTLTGALRRKYLSDVPEDKIVSSSWLKISKRPLKRRYW